MAGKSAHWSDAKTAFLFTLALRFLYSAIAILCLPSLRPSPPESARVNALLFDVSSLHPHLETWARFDTVWYLHISRQGYDLPASVVFYPLYPGLIRLLSPLMHPLFAALLISTSAAFFLFWGILRLSRMESPECPAWRTLLLYAAWPVSFVFFVGYTEALCAAAMVWALVLAREARWPSAAICGALAALSRAAGALVAIPLLLMAWRKRETAAWPALLVPLAGAAFPLWLRWTGHISIADAYRKYWTTQVAAPWTGLWLGLQDAFRSPTAISLGSAAILLAFLYVTAAGKMRPELRLYTLAVIALTLMKLGPNFLVGCARYLLPAFPVFLVLACYLKRYPKPAFLALCGALFAFNLAWMYAFLNWSFIF
ncbi:MAG: hypothetical protein JST79_08660 [Acidobacteria bacterium]|nr:hypothetical protein [Acidobacteriota bacterium]